MGNTLISGRDSAEEDDALGLPVALTASGLAQGLLFGVNPIDVGSLLAAAAVVCVVGLVAGYIPARRAARIDPLQALRADSGAIRIDFPAMQRV